MSKPTDVRVVATRLYFIPIETRVPLKFGPETVTSVTVARVCVTVEDARGKRAEGWGETPLSVQWVWPSTLPYAFRHDMVKRFTTRLAEALVRPDFAGHAFEVGHDWQELLLPKMLAEFNRGASDPMPLLAGLVCLSLFDIALHDAFGQLHQRPIYSTYTSEFISRDLSEFLSPAGDAPRELSFANKFPADFLVANPPRRLLA
jgi:L-alanine-DL-glutamate epimerase-like enolase superfamily enzyme